MKQKIEIKSKFGLHARPATKLVELCSKFDSELSIEFSNQVINLKSIMSILALDARDGDIVTIVAKGNDEKEAIREIAELINNKFS